MFPPLRFNASNVLLPWFLEIDEGICDGEDRGFDEVEQKKGRKWNHITDYGGGFDCGHFGYIDWEIVFFSPHSVFFPFQMNFPKPFISCKSLSIYKTSCNFLV